MPTQNQNPCFILKILDYALVLVTEMVLVLSTQVATRYSLKAGGRCQAQGATAIVGREMSRQVAPTFIKL